MVANHTDDLIKFVGVTSGRDKINRLVQYACRLLLWYSKRNGLEENDAFSRIKSLEAAISLSRKLFRIGNSIDFGKKALAGLANSDPAIKTLTFTSFGGKAGWLFLDHIIWANKVRLLDVDASYLSKWSARLWLIGCFSAFLLSLYRLLAAVEELRRISGDKSTCKRRVSTLRMEMLRDLCDCFIPLTILNKVDPGIGWTAGVVSSIVALKMEWRKIIFGQA